MSEAERPKSAEEWEATTRGDGAKGARIRAAAALRFGCYWSPLQPTRGARPRLMAPPPALPPFGALPRLSELLPDSDSVALFFSSISHASQYDFHVSQF